MTFGGLFDGDFLSSLQEACLHRLLQGLIIYTFLLKRVEEECPSSMIPVEARYFSGVLIREVEKKVGLRCCTLLFLTKHHRTVKKNAPITLLNTT